MARLELIPTDEEREIRAAVRGICNSFPEDYSRTKHAAGEPPSELWDALAEKGYLGVNLPEEWAAAGSACRASPRSARRSRHPASRCC